MKIKILFSKLKLKIELSHLGAAAIDQHQLLLGKTIFC